MARASFIIKKDGRYWFQKRFGIGSGRMLSLPSHCRIALRTGDYGVAYARMLKVASLMHQFEVQADLVARANVLVKQMQRFNMKLGTDDAEVLVERRTLETLVSRLISEARFRSHPLVDSPKDFWPTWLSFANGNAMIEANQELRARQPSAPVRETRASGRSRAEPLITTSTPDTSHAASSEFGPDARISEVRQAYMDQRRIADGDGRAEEDVGLVIQFLADFLDDKPINEVSASDLMRVENALPNVPHPHGVPKDHQTSLYRRWLYAEQNGWDGLKAISRTRLRNGWHGGLHTFLKWAKKRGAYVGPEYEFRLVARKNPKEKQRDAWREEEIIKLFSLPLFVGCKSAGRFWQPGNVFTQNHIYWAYLLIFFTGMRPSEIGKLRNDQVIEIEGDWYFDFRNAEDMVEGERVKTEAGKRLIPIPRLLIDLGLLDRRDYLVGRNEKRLFPDWKVYIHKKSGREMWGHEFSKSWQYIKEKFEFDRPTLTLYGGRHTRATWYDEFEIPQRVRIRLLGHAPKTEADRYGAVHLTPAEAKMVLSKVHVVEQAVAEILIEAKLKAEYGQLKPAKMS